MGMAMMVVRTLCALDLVQDVQGVREFAGADLTVTIGVDQGERLTERIRAGGRIRARGGVGAERALNFAEAERAVAVGVGGPDDLCRDVGGGGRRFLRRQQGGQGL